MSHAGKGYTVALNLYSQWHEISLDLLNLLMQKWKHKESTKLSVFYLFIIKYNNYKTSITLVNAKINV